MVEKTWLSTPHGVELRMTVTVNGETVTACFIMNDRNPFDRNPPSDYIERELRHRLMRAVEAHLFDGRRR